MTDNSPFLKDAAEALDGWYIKDGFWHNDKMHITRDRAATILEMEMWHLLTIPQSEWGAFGVRFDR